MAINPQSDISKRSGFEMNNRGQDEDNEGWEENLEERPSSAYNKEGNEENNRREENIECFKPCWELRHLLSCLKFGGIYLSDEKYSGNSGHPISKCSFLLRLCFQIMMVSLIWINLGRTVVSMWMSPGSQLIIASKLALVFWNAQISLQATVCGLSWYNITNRKPSLKTFLTFLKQNHQALGDFVEIGYISKLVRRLFVFMIVVAFSNIMLQVLITFVPGSIQFKHQTSAFLDPLPNSLIFQILTVFVLQPYLTVAWLLPLGFYFIICCFLLHQCKSLETKMNQVMKENDLEKIKSLRRQHCTICDTITKADDVFTYITLSVYVTYIPLICVLLFNFLFIHTDSVSVKISWGIWTLMAVSTLSVISFGGALVNNKIHSFIVYLQGMEMRGINLGAHAELMLFISKLNGQPVSFTAGKILVIDNSLIVTVIGVVLTYFALLYQLK